MGQEDTDTNGLWLGSISVVVLEKALCHLDDEVRLGTVVPFVTGQGGCFLKMSLIFSLATKFVTENFNLCLNFTVDYTWSNPSPIFAKY